MQNVQNGANKAVWNLRCILTLSLVSVPMPG